MILAHAGPTGLGSDVESPCGRDWKVPNVDWGDKDLELAIDKIRKKRIPDLVVFGHMHHELKSGRGISMKQNSYFLFRIILTLMTVQISKNLRVAGNSHSWIII